MARKRCECPIKGAGKEKECFNSWWGPGDGRCTCYCHEEDLFNRAEGRRLAEDGAARAAEHAERVSAGWVERAVTFVGEYALEHSDGTFMAEDIREEAYERGFPRPPDNRAWGHVMKKAQGLGMIIHVGFGTAKAKNCHANPKGVWKTHDEWKTHEAA